MKSRLFALAILLFLGGCSEENLASSVLDVQVSKNGYYFIPGTVTSCYGRKTFAINDIPTDYVTIPIVSFTRKKTDKELFISFLRIKMKLPAGEITCSLGGDELAALDDRWWSNGMVASIPVGQETFQTTCPIRCGGVDTGGVIFSAPATLEIFGFERDSVSKEEFPVKVQTTFTVQAI